MEKMHISLPHPLAHFVYLNVLQKSLIIIVLMPSLPVKCFIDKVLVKEM